MDVNTAFQRGIRSSDVNVTCDGRYRGRWICWVPDATKPHGQRLLTSFAPAFDAAYDAASWRGRLREMEEAAQAHRDALYKAEQDAVEQMSNKS